MNRNSIIIYFGVISATSFHCCYCIDAVNVFVSEILIILTISVVELLYFGVNCNWEKELYRIGVQKRIILQRSIVVLN